MKNWQQTLVTLQTPIVEAVRILDETAAKICLVVDEERQLLGTVTDGDVRRGLLRKLDLSTPVKMVMNAAPKYLAIGESRDSIQMEMDRQGIVQIPLLDTEGRVAGLATRDDLSGATEPRSNWVVLMAGGLGQRLRPLTNDTPKPLLKVGEKPVLEVILENFKRHDFQRFYISVNYKAEMVKSYFGDGSNWGVEILYLQEDKALGTAGALSLLPERPQEPFFVMNGDLLTKLNFDSMLEFHSEHDALGTMGVREYDLQVPFGVVQIEDGRIATIDEKPVHRFFVNAGVYVMGPDALDFVPNGTFYDMPDLFRDIVKAGGETAVFPIREYWLDIGRMDDFDRANRDFSEQFNR